jgi:hypothetical protein
MGRFPPPPLRKRTFDDSRQLPSTEGMSFEERRRSAAETWRKLREHEPPNDMEEMRRRAVQEWRAKYGPDKKP